MPDSQVSREHGGVVIDLSQLEPHAPGRSVLPGTLNEVHVHMLFEICNGIIPVMISRRIIDGSLLSLLAHHGRYPQSGRLLPQWASSTVPLMTAKLRRGIWH